MKVSRMILEICLAIQEHLDIIATRTCPSLPELEHRDRSLRNGEEILG